MSHWEVINGRATLCTSEEEGRRCRLDNGFEMWIENSCLPDGHEAMTSSSVIDIAFADYGCPLCGMMSCEHDDTDWFLSNEANRDHLLASIAELDRKVNNEKLDRINREIEEEKFINLSDMTRKEPKAHWLKKLGTFADLDDSEVFHNLRVQKLQDEFEAKRNGHPEYWAWNWSADDWAEDEGDDSEYSVAVCQAARRYIVARDFGEFDPLKADNLWKRHHGGAR